MSFIIALAIAFYILLFYIFLIDHRTQQHVWIRFQYRFQFQQDELVQDCILLFSVRIVYPVRHHDCSHFRRPAEYGHVSQNPRISHHTAKRAEILRVFIPDCTIQPLHITHRVYAVRRRYRVFIRHILAAYHLIHVHFDHIRDGAH